MFIYALEILRRRMKVTVNEVELLLRGIFFTLVQRLLKKWNINMIELQLMQGTLHQILHLHMMKLKALNASWQCSLKQSYSLPSMKRLWFVQKKKLFKKHLLKVVKQEMRLFEIKSKENVWSQFMNNFTIILPMKNQRFINNWSTALK